MKKEEIRYGKTSEGYSIFLLVMSDDRLRMTTPTYISGMSNVSIEISYNYDVPRNTFLHEDFEEITRKEFFQIKREKEAEIGVKFKLLKKITNR